MESPIDAVITSYEPPALLVATQKAEPDAGITLLLEMSLEFEVLEGGRTRLHLTQDPFDSDEWVEMTREAWGTSFTKRDTLFVRA